MNTGKNRLFILVFSLLFLLVINQNVFALNPNKSINQYVLDSWQIEDGLPQNSVRAITQTKDGYIWLGTQEGVVRFDGVKFTIFDKALIKTIKSNEIRALLEDSRGNLWIGTFGGGLLQYDGKNFIHHGKKSGLNGSQVHALAEDGEGHIWVGTDLGLYCRLLDIFESINLTSSDQISEVTALLPTGRNQMWIGSSKGLKFYNGNQIQDYKSKNDNPLFKGPVHSLLIDSLQNIWVGTFGHGLGKIGNNQEKIFTTAQGLGDDKITALWQDREKNLWIGTYGGGINRLKKDGGFESFTSHSGLSDDMITALYEDREGSLWVGTTSGGLNRFKDEKITAFTKKDGLSHNLVFPIYEDREGDLWVGTYGGGLNKYSQGKFTSLTTEDGLTDNFITAIHQTKDRALWVGTYDSGINIIRGDQIQVISTKQGLSSNLIYSIYQDSRNNVWVGTRKGLNLIKPNGKIISFSKKDGLPDEVIRPIIEDKNGHMWFGTQQGLSRYDYQDNKFSNLGIAKGLSHPRVQCFYLDQDNILWAGTAEGLNRIENGKITGFTSKDGLFDDRIMQILEDGQNNLWLSCNKGIFRINKKDLQRFTKGEISKIPHLSYGKSDGMKSSECNGGPQPPGWKSRDNILWFPTIKGMVRIDTENVTVNKTPPPVVLEKVMTDNQTIDLTPPISLSAGTQKIEFHYTALSFINPAKIRFKYKLDGFDKKWVEAGGRRVAYYTNIPPGKYLFKVIACNNDNIWNRKGNTFPFQIAPHFYQTKLFYLLCAVGLMLIGASIYSTRARRMKLRQRELEALSRNLKKEVEQQTKELRDQRRELALSNIKLMEQSEKLKEHAQDIAELDRQKTSFFQNISHELRTPLTLIINPLDEYCQEHPRDNQMQMAAKNSRRLLRLVNQFLDFQKISAGKMNLSLTPVNLVPFIESISEYFAPLCKRKGLHFITNQQKNQEIYIEAEIDALEKIIFNLLSNALKYTPEGGNIFLNLDLIDKGHSGKWVMLSVEDTGNGISPEEQNKLFKIFSQLENTVSDQYDGTGLGLALVKELAEAMKGRVGVESEVDKGSKFWVIFPVYEELSDEVTRRVKMTQFRDWHFADSTVVMHTELNQEIYSESPEQTESFSRELILVVDDLPDMRKMIGNILTKEHYRVVTASDGSNGIKAAKEHNPKLIICDWMMPRVTGPEMIIKIKADPELSSIPIILVTAKSDEESRMKGIEIGADGYLGKPFEARELVSMMQNLLNLKQKEQVYSQELQLAANLQNSVHLELSGDYHGIKISSFYKSCSEVGGDFMVVNEVNDKSLFIGQCDLCGHGPQASLLSFYLRGVLDSIFDTLPDQNMEPELLLQYVIRKMDYQLREKIGDSKFATFFFIFLDKVKKRIYYQSGGHPPGILRHPSGQYQIIQGSSLPLGLYDLLEDEDLSGPEIHNLELPEKFLLLITTDSVYELKGSKFFAPIVGPEKFVQLTKQYIEQTEKPDAEDYAKYFLEITGNSRYDDDCSVLFISG